MLRLNVPYLRPADLDHAVRKLLHDYAAWKKTEVVPPIDVDDTLVRNVERDIRQVLRGVWTECTARVDLPDADALGGMLAGLPTGISSFGLPSGAGADVETTMLATLVARVVEKDADLVVSIVLLGETQNEAAARLGIGHEAARKRFQRALRRMRDGLQES